MNILFVIGVGLLWLMPPRPGVDLSEEAWQRYRQMGLNSYQGIARTESSRTQLLGVEGEQHFPVVIMQYSDVSAAYGSDDFQQMLFDGPWSSGTAHDYYTEVSYGTIDLKGIVVGPYTADHSRSYYADNNYGIGDDFNRSAGALVWEACQASDPHVDYSIYDNDGDGFVDIFTVIHVGYGAEETDDTEDIWSHEFSLEGWGYYGGPGIYTTDDPDPNNPGTYIKIDVYTMNPEQSNPPQSDISNIGVFCHEWGHGFGLPDLYITEGPNAGGAGLGYFCLMAAGSWGGDPPGSKPVHLSSWCKYFLGWLEPEALERDSLEELPSASLPDVTSTPTAYRILSNPGGVDWSFTSTGDGEFFLVENRQRNGFDAGLPGSGLLILHVDESRETNSDVDNPLVGIMQADGDPDYLFISTGGSASDLWSRDSLGFSNSSTPSSRFFDGAPSGVSVTNISSSGSDMTADLKIEPLLLGRVFSYPNPFIPDGTNRVTIVYEPTDEDKLAGEYPDFRVYIYDLSGKRVRILDDKPDEISIYGRTAFWDGENDWSRPVASGLYFYVIEIYEGDWIKEHQKGMLTIVR